VQLIISDQHTGLISAIKRCFKEASHQRCRVHFTRNLLATIPKRHQPMVSAAFKTVFAQVSGPDMHAQWDRVVTTLEDRFAKGVAFTTGTKEEVLALTAFPTEHWRQIWSTNPLERLNKELKRRCRVVGIFPNEASVIRLGGAVLLDVHDEWVSAERRYFSEASIAKLYRVVDNDNAPVEELTSSD
jgi:putative transposase